jgi:hypothetical protein
MKQFIMKKNIYLLLAGALFLGACSNSDDPVTEGTITFNNFEGVDGWNAKFPTITKEKAHSGQYSLKVDKDNEYSVGFNKMLGEVSSKRPKKIKVEAWVFVPSKETGAATLAFTVNNPQGGDALLWDGIKLAEEVDDFREWEHVEKEFKLPDNIQVTNTISSYLWRSGATEPVYVDDMKISIVD